MEMITQNTDKIQEVLAKIFRDIPVVLSAGAACLYFLVKDLSEELEEFILGGRAGAAEFHVFPKGEMEEMASRFEAQGLTVTYRSQQIEYMYRQAAVIYPQVGDPATGMKISLIPWFMLPGRPYPIFTYVYAIWHYQASGKKSMRLSAAAAGRIFGAGSFNKSTLCRNLRAMARLFEMFQIDSPLSVEARAAPSAEEVIGAIPELLRGCPPIGELGEMYDGQACRLPGGGGNAESVSRALSGIPHECADAIKNSGPAEGHRRDARKRPPRPHGKRKKRVQRGVGFAEPHKIEQIRRAFIAGCRGIVMDAAGSCHQFLL